MKTNTGTVAKADNQVTGNIGLYYVCYQLSRLGWNVLPTARNAKGVDAMAYNSDASVKVTVQVKALTGRSAVALGPDLDHLIADYLVVCRRVRDDAPEVFILTRSESKELACKNETRNEGGKARISWWIEPRDYEQERFKDRWRIIGTEHTRNG